jgi:hypothetical protein
MTRDHELTRDLIRKGLGRKRAEFTLFNNIPLLRRPREGLRSARYGLWPHGNVTIGSHPAQIGRTADGWLIALR